MKKYWIATLLLASLMATATYAQQPTQASSSANAVSTPPRRTSSRDGLDRKGGVNVGREGSAKMKDGVSRSGNSNLSPTSPTNVPPPGGDRPGKPMAKPADPMPAGKMADKPARPTRPKGPSTRNGNTAYSGASPMQTQGSTSIGTASEPTPGGAKGTGVKAKP